ALIREKNGSNFSQRLQTAKILTLARQYEDEPRFYFPYQLDFRGRIYAVPSYLNPQGTDLAKGVLRFADGKPLGTMQAVRWLAIHGSNTWGNDKVSLDDRHSWVLQHQQEILECAADPFNNTWWHDADAPFCFLAFCHEWAGYVREGLAFVSHLPIAMDGTCNGLQIFSLLLRDEVGGRAVNLLPADTPQDIYQIVADKVKERLHADAADKTLDANVLTAKDGKPLYNPYRTARMLLTMGIDRKTTKRQVMVLPYGGTQESCREYTEAWIKGKISAGFALPGNFTTRGTAVYLASLIWEAIGTTVIAARDAMSFLQKVAGVLNKADLPIKWTTPAGLPVVQAYKEMQGRLIETRLGDKVIQTLISEENYVSDTGRYRFRKERKETQAKKRTSRFAHAKQRSAISPNYVH
ncbi:MAG: DNA-dependent RNA polymerase, partial [Desulfovibrionaceae bacterium]|nr:DNA-dependent RNA polymerase [Desulfovibrionaceae bacterium]